jgi:hypothetical protein
MKSRNYEQPMRRVDDVFSVMYTEDEMLTVKVMEAGYRGGKGLEVLYAAVVVDGDTGNNLWFRVTEDKVERHDSNAPFGLSPDQAKACRMLWNEQKKIDPLTVSIESDE